MHDRTLDWYFGRLDMLNELQDYRYFPCVQFWDIVAAITKRTEKEIEEEAEEEQRYWMSVGGTDCE